MNPTNSGRHLSIWTASSFVVASMIGTGVFTSLGFQLVDIQSVFPMMMLWIVGGVVALCGALVYSELGTSLPRSGGEDHKFIGFLNKKNSDEIPINAFLVQLGISFLFILTSSFEQVLMYAGISLIMTTTLTVVSLFTLRFKEPNLDRPYTVWGYPFTPIIFLIVNFWILFYSFRETTFESMVGIGIVSISIGLYYLMPAFKKES